MASELAKRILSRIEDDAYAWVDGEYRMVRAEAEQAIDAELADVREALEKAEHRLVVLHSVGSRHFKVAAGDITPERDLLRAAIASLKVPHE